MASGAPALDDLAQLTPTLASLGWTERLDRWAEEVGPALAEGGEGPLVRGRLARVNRGFSLVFTGGDALLAASGTGRTGLGDAPATGDFVLVRLDPRDGPILVALAERTTALCRRAPGRLPEPQVLAANMPLLKAVGEIIRHEIVLVQDGSKKIVGIVTTTDLSMQLRDLTDAFLLVRNIEGQIRRLIGKRFKPEVLRAFVPPETGRIVHGVEDLSFGEYLRLLQVPEHWSKLGLKVDAAVVLKRLEEVRTIRNAVMHFRSDSVSGIDLESLRLTEAFLGSLSPT